MFDFFKDVYLEVSGVDSTAAEAERSEKRTLKDQEKEGKKKIIFSRGTKLLVFVVGIFYLLVTGAGIIAMKEIGELDVVGIIQSILLSVCDIACLVCLAIGTKKTEIAAIILMVVFLFAQYFTVLLV